MHIKNGFSLTSEGEHSVIFKAGEPLVGNTGHIFLNERDVFLWQLLEKGCASKTEMLESLLREFDISTVLALGNIDTFLRIMKENGIIEE